MPQLLAFLPCEKTIIANDQTLSLVGLIDTLTTNVPPGQSVPQNAVAPYRWTVVTIFRRLPEDEGKRFRQRVVVVLPNGQSAAEGVTDFSMTHTMVRNLNAFEGFPVGFAGECKVRLFVDDLGKPASAEPVAEFPVQVVHTPAAQGVPA
jgi:hypothetical protein